METESIDPKIAQIVEKLYEATKKKTVKWEKENSKTYSWSIPSGAKVTLREITNYIYFSVFNENGVEILSNYYEHKLKDRMVFKLYTLVRNFYDKEYAKMLDDIMTELKNL